MCKRLILILGLIFVVVGCEGETQSAILADLEQRTGGAATQLVDFEEVTWLDTSWGCPEPGHVYQRPLVDGTRVVFSDSTTEYNYHTFIISGQEDFIFCENPDETGWVPR